MSVVDRDYGFEHEDYEVLAATDPTMRKHGDGAILCVGQACENPRSPDRPETR